LNWVKPDSYYVKFVVKNIDKRMGSGISKNLSYKLGALSSKWWQ